MQEQEKRMERMERIAAALLLILGAALRLCALGALPFGLNQDEASAGYEAFALLTAGIDRCGKSWPSWKTIVHGRRCVGTELTSRPRMNTSPRSRGSSPSMARSSVDLPEPEAPSRATISPSPKARPTPSRARNPLG